ncbi:MAG TPA: M36 family metallopeptidase, partial [Actinomycetota bacterium]|nr:M36 family metallopeptidase [Actinomycetota bacterium]
RAGTLIVAPEGMVVVAIVGGRVTFAASSLVGTVAPAPAPTLSLEDAVVAAASDGGGKVAPGDVSRRGRVRDWIRLNVRGLQGVQLARRGARPWPGAGVRSAYETYLMDEDGSRAFRHFVDARTGEVVIRWREVDFAGEPTWEVFPAYPPLDYSSTDTRETWCWTPAEGCDLVLSTTLSRPPAARVPWDVNPRINSPTFTSFGNNARTTEKWLVPVGSATVAGVSTGPTVGVVPNTPRPNRDYVYPWTNRWFEQRCNPATAYLPPQLNDLDAAIANLFAMHNRMHDWSYWLGFTEETWNGQDSNFGNTGPDRRENDPERGNAQAGALTGGPPAFLSRDNANQFTPPDGSQPVTNMFLWQPVARAWYGPCVDGDFDMSVIAHEYTHMISNRMVAGPDQRLVGLQANAMGESWSDLVAVEYLNEYGFVPVAGENPFAVGAYVTRDPQAGIRNYGMNQSPLNYSDVGYDLTGPQVHADGEIWSATNFDIRQAMIERYGSLAARDATLQRRCADGQLPADRCPGNRRWVQLVFDAWLLMPPSGEVTMLDARDAMLAADRMRFGGANQDLLWNVFARRGFGENATSKFGSNDDEPRPSFESPFSGEATLTFRPVDAAGNPIADAELYVGHYEARVTPVADTAAHTDRPATVQMVPGTYDFVARADGYGMKRCTVTVAKTSDLGVAMPLNLASRSNGAAAAGDGVNQDRLIDDTEETNWASFGADVRGRQVTVRL